MKAVEMDEVKKMNQSTQADNFNLTSRTNRSGKHAFVKRNNRETLTLKKPELFMYELQQSSLGKRISPQEIKENLKLRRPNQN